MSERSTTTRERIVHAAATLLAEGGRDAVSTRAVGAAAGVQAPTIYRLFGDKQGLLDAVASHGFAVYLRGKTSREHDPDPVEDLRRGWDLHVEFGTTNPAFYTLMYGDFRPGAAPEAVRESAEILHGLVLRIAEAGRLRVGVERAARMIHSASSGVVLSLISTAPGDRDPDLSRLVREAVLAAVTTDPPGEAPDPADDRAASHAIALKAALPRSTPALTPAERDLLSEWLDRISRAGSR
ncbi:TetR/AcrR family transcriptional regulator [Actinorugispora endophytica]|uniref:TetR family transcriptional regulator n=1 Tax=Actinorugispora endophytica TaxID=1605990 RepID=A0A4R6UXV6_9ACTN|nr:TetR/AcrR family transcriptional regulator [Actinorugispora endophytica]TDQ52279.1 TetR family transcriptional regulator [Actinorugispora endophytica]